METRTNHQIITGQDGLPAAVVIPYQDYIENYPVFGDDITLPHEVVGYILQEDLTYVAAWRKYLGLTQSDMAERMGISQSAYSQIEASHNPRASTLTRVANAMDINVEKLIA